MNCPHCKNPFPVDWPKGLYGTMKCRECWRKDARAILDNPDVTSWSKRLARRLVLLDVIYELIIVPSPMWSANVPAQHLYAC